MELNPNNQLEHKLYGVCPTHKKQSYFIFKLPEDIIKQQKETYQCGRCYDYLTLDEAIAEDLI